MLAALSNDEVASSKRYTGVSRKSARASAILCFCPPDKLDPLICQYRVDASWKMGNYFINATCCNDLV